MFKTEYPIKDEEILHNDPKLKEALKKLNEHAIEKQVEYRKSKLPPDSDYLRPVMERPIHGKTKKLKKKSKNFFPNFFQFFTNKIVPGK